MTTQPYTRLHVTPLDPASISAVLGGSLAKSVENISFHSIETFPENDYGFIDLPEPDAKVLISRLNGALLRGRKMKVEKARPKKRSADLSHEVDLVASEPPRKKKKGAVKDETTIQGYELPAGRKVKRGWTDPRHEESARSKRKEKKSKQQATSRYTETEELLFRTKIPANRKKSKSKSKQHRGKGDAEENVVHEFEKTDIQPDFVRDTTISARAAEYIDDIGWVDKDGGVIEKVPSSASRKRYHKAEGLRIGVPITTGAKSLDAQSSSSESTSSDDTDDSATSGDRIHAALGTSIHQQDTSSPVRDQGSHSDSSSASDSEHSDDEDSKTAVHDQPQLQDSTAPETPQKVHPLEALFKKPKLDANQESAKPSLEIETSFSFFDQAAADEKDELPPMPATPFTSLDMRSREIRSAAPTPDTAHPSRFASFASALDDQSAGEHSDEETSADPSVLSGPAPTSEKMDERAPSEFEKRFWAERGQNNRAWKARRKTAMKEQRQRDNRLRRPRNW